jgi:hypothetical protein
MLVEAHKDLARLQGQAAELAQERQAVAATVERRKAERTRAQDYAGAIRDKALAAKVDQRPVELIDAERLLGETISELDFAEAALSKAEAALRSCEFAVSEASKGLRVLAHAVAVEVAENQARELRALEAQVNAKRTAFRGTLQAFLTHGVKFGPVSAEMWQMPPPPTYQPERNSIPWRREMQIAEAWRSWVERAIKNPNAETPKEE